MCTIKTVDGKNASVGKGESRFLRRRVIASILGESVAGAKQTGSGRRKKKKSKVSECKAASQDDHGGLAFRDPVSRFWEERIRGHYDGSVGIETLFRVFLLIDSRGFLWTSMISLRNKDVGLGGCF